MVASTSYGALQALPSTETVTRYLNLAAPIFENDTRHAHVTEQMIIDARVLSATERSPE